MKMMKDHGPRSCLGAGGDDDGGGGGKGDLGLQDEWARGFSNRPESQ